MARIVSATFVNVGLADPEEPINMLSPRANNLGVQPVVYIYPILEECQGMTHNLAGVMHLYSRKASERASEHTCEVGANLGQ